MPAYGIVDAYKSTWGSIVHGFRPRMRGFSLIELMVAIAVLAIGLMVAIPSFNETRQRNALRGASDQIVSFWANARFEALKRNQPIRVGLYRDGDNFCLGANTASSLADTASCNCLTSACDVANYPASQAEWRGMRAPAGVGKNGAAFAVIDPKRGALGAPGQAGFWQLRAPFGGPDYRLNVAVNIFGRAVTCEPSAAGSKIPQFTNRRC